MSVYQNEQRSVSFFKAIGVESEEDIALLAKYLHRLDVVQPQFPKPQVTLAVNGVEDEGDDEVVVDEVGSVGDEGADIRQVLIGPNDVIKALRQFVEDNNQPSRYIFDIFFS